jgi:hypothetical protein
MLNPYAQGSPIVDFPLPKNLGTIKIVNFNTFELYPQFFFQPDANIRMEIYRIARREAHATVADIKHVRRQ